MHGKSRKIFLLQALTTNEQPEPCDNILFMKAWIFAMAVVMTCSFTASQAMAHGKNAGLSGKLLPSTAPVQILPEPWPTGYLNFELPQCGPIAYSPSTDHLYLVDSDGNRLVETDRKGNVLSRIPVGMGPAGVAVSPDGGVLYVTDHLSDSITVIDSATREPLAVIQQVDPDTRVAVLDEPCGVAFSPTKPEAYVTLGQPNQLAVIDTTNHTIKKILPLQGEEPRAVTVSPDGAWVYVAALESGNRTEVLLSGEGKIDDSDPLLWAWNYLQFIISSFLEEEEIVQIDDPAYPDQDIFVIDAETYKVTTISRVGTLLYGLTSDVDGSLWVTMTDHLNFKDGPKELDGRPILNRLVRLTPGAAGWVASDKDSFPMDENASGQPIPGGAVPYAVTTTDQGQVLVTAASSGALLVVDPITGLVNHRIPVGALPRGVVAVGNHAYVYNRGDMTLSIVSLGDGNTAKPAEVHRVAFATDPAPSHIQEGRRLFYDARFSSNGTFACGSCHADGHTDHLVWDLGDGPRSTMTVRGIAGTEGFHWDGTKATAQQLVIDGVTGDVFQGTIESNEVANMAAFILKVSFPPSPFRAPTDQLSPSAREGAVITRRGVWQDAQHKAIGTQAQFDPAFEELFHEWGGPNLIPREGEGCALSGCHTAPLWTTPNSSPEFIEAVTFRGMWDRNTWIHNGATSKRGTLTATNIYREFFGHPKPYQGFATATASSGGFFTTAFRHEWDATNPEGKLDPVILMPRIEAYQFELSTGVPGALGRSALFDGSPTPEEAQILTEIINAAAAHKVRMRVEGTLGGASISWIWLPDTNEFQTAQGTILSYDEVTALLNQAGGYTLRVRADLPVDTEDQPLLENIVDGDDPNKLVTAVNGKTQTFILQGRNFKPGMWILVDGWRYAQPAVLNSQTAEHIEDPVNAAGPYYIISVLNPDGLQSNEFPVPVLHPETVSSSLPKSFAPSMDNAPSPLP